MSCIFLLVFISASAITYINYNVTQVLNAQGRSNLVENIVNNLKNAQDFIQKRAVGNFGQADADFGKRLAKGLDRAKQVSDDDDDDKPSTESAPIEKPAPLKIVKQELQNGNTAGRQSPKFKLVNWDGEPVL